MNAWQEQIREFMQKAGQATPDRPVARIPMDVAHLRLRLIREEYSELEQAVRSGFHLNDDIMLEEIADALADLIYVVVGSAVAWGIDIEPVFEEVHRANMAKFGPGSKQRPDGKWLKPPDWERPDIARILAEQMD